jgi:hypothetical protein
MLQWKIRIPRLAGMKNLNYLYTALFNHFIIPTIVHLVIRIYFAKPHVDFALKKPN